MSAIIAARLLQPSCRAKARRNAASLDYWIEGVELNEFYGQFTLAAAQYWDLAKTTLDPRIARRAAEVSEDA